MTQEKKIALAKELFKVFNNEDRVDFIAYANNEYYYSMGEGFTFESIVDTFKNDSELDDYACNLLNVVSQYHTEDEKWYADFERITGYADHVKFVYSIQESE